MQGRRREKEGQHLFNFLSITDTLEKASIFDKKKKEKRKKEDLIGVKGLPAKWSNFRVHCSDGIVNINC